MIRTIVHLSDLHFGRTERVLLDPLVEVVQRVQPDVIVISGDLTQDARDGEFAQARRFVDRLPEPRIVIPGNHDMPFYNPIRRVARGLDGYRRWFGDNLEPCYSDAEVTIASVNTVRLFPIRGGRINERQIGAVKQQMRAARPGATRILVTHHPFDLAETYPTGELAGRAALAMERLAQCIDVLLAGHHHVAHCGRTAVRYKTHGHSAVFVQAGTAISSRVRGEPNSFNVLRLHGNRIDIQRCSWIPDRMLFEVALTDAFVRATGGWERVPAEQLLRAG
ncbi:MAG TPA: metallophosphoesterase [Bryobacteraceae bacterium]|nr:metallophosphoesterase [Bryobacteraceae bacterium]